MPLPLNHRTKRLSMGVSAAYAEPVELNIVTSGGTPTVMAEPPIVTPFKKARRETLLRRVITCDMSFPPAIRELQFPDQRYHKLLKPELRIAKLFPHSPDQRGIRRGLGAPGHPAEILFHHALLAYRRLGQHRAQ